jgi:hypothetical protein
MDGERITVLRSRFVARGLDAIAFSLPMPSHFTRRAD